MIKKIKKGANKALKGFEKYEYQEWAEKDLRYIPEGDLRKILIPIDKIIPLKDNPRFNDKTVKDLVKVIKEVGFRRPIVLNDKYEIKAGNTAYKAAMQLKMKFIPAVRTAFISEDHEWKVVLSDNKIGEKSEWNNDVLKKLMDSGKILLESKGYGFTETELFNIRNLKKEAQKFTEKNTKNIMLGKLLNNLTKYEINNNKSLQGEITKLNFYKGKYAYKIEENNEEMIIFHRKLDVDRGENKRKVSKSRGKK